MGTPVVVVGQTRYDENLYHCILNGKQRILFEDEISLDQEDFIVHDGLQGFSDGK